MSTATPGGHLGLGELPWVPSLCDRKTLGAVTHQTLLAWQDKDWAMWVSCGICQRTLVLG